MKPQNLRLEKLEPRSWAFNRPPGWELFDYKLERAIAAERRGEDEAAKRIYLELLEACPEYLPALNNLGLLLKSQGDLEGGVVAFAEAVEIGLACLPEEFVAGEDLIPWHWEDNRPFLLAYENLGRCYLEQARDTFDHLLELNPGYRGITDLLARLNELCGVETESIG